MSEHLIETHANLAAELRDLLGGRCAICSAPIPRPTSPHWRALTCGERCADTFVGYLTGDHSEPGRTAGLAALVRQIDTLERELMRRMVWREAVIDLIYVDHSPPGPARRSELISVKARLRSRGRALARALPAGGWVAIERHRRDGSTRIHRVDAA